MIRNRSTRGRAIAALLFTSWASTGHSQGPNGPTRSTPTAVAEVTPEELRMETGEQRTLTTENVRSYSEGAKGIVDVRLTKDGSQFVIVALAHGTTTLLLIMMDGTERHYRIQVGDPAVQGRRSAGNGVTARDNIRLDFYFVQVQKSYSHQLGVTWPTTVIAQPTVNFDVLTRSITNATAVISTSALPRLDIGQQAGWAKVMRQAAVVAANGEKAQFSGGGEVNIPVQTALTTGLQKVSFGSEIQVEPQYDAGTGRVELRLSADISELDSDRGTGIPGRVTSKLETVVNLELGQSLILGGLTARSERTSKSGIPGLSQIPILGLLFGTHTKAEEESENVVIIVPSVVDAVSLQARARLDEAMKAFADYSGDIDKVDLVPPAPPARPVRR